MPRVEFLPAEVVVEVPEGTTLLEAARLARLRVEAPCNGAGTCGKCKATVADGLERLRLFPREVPSAEEVAERRILLCCAAVQGDVRVELSGAAATAGMQILASGAGVELPVDPWIRKRHDAAAGRTLVEAGGAVIAEEEGDTTARVLGVAVDVGTTTLVATLVDLLTGAELGATAALNPQATHAQDVLSRIQLGSRPEGLALLHGELMAELDRMIGELTAEARVARRRVYEVVLSGNTCMLHLAAGIDPKALGRHPYTPATRGGVHLGAEEVGLTIARAGLVWLPPIISGYVGADITAGILSTGLAQAAGVTLFVDVGTNGEMVLAVDGVLRATSTAAGPAFEGMNIAHGMRAAPGAVERFTIEDGEVRVETIGAKPPIGICGSGLLDAVGELAAHGVIDASGRFTRTPEALPPGLAGRLEPRDATKVFRIAGDVVLTQKDVRQVQLAKGAVRAGVDLLLRSAGLGPLDVDRALIAGSFGYHLRTRSLLDLGLFPAELDGRVTYVGNTSQTGARALLLNRGARSELTELAKRVTVVELANDPGFQKAFVAALAFPGSAPWRAVAA
ncbi:MAG: ASKHA domain-containing protein [Anaeromyxobacteraceae bacterium]